MKYFLSILITVILFSYCNSENKDNKSTNEDTKQTEEKDTVSTDVSGCYRRIVARDTFTAVFEQQGTVINGRLIFDNYGKDGSSGDITGKMEGDIIKLVYTFNSEGMKSVMQVYFRYQNSNLIRGIGDIGTKRDTTYFTKPEMIVFPEDEVWQKISCDAVSIDK